MLKSEKVMDLVFETVSPRATVSEALTIMVEHKLDSIFVVEDLLNKKYLGNVSDHEILRQVFATGKDPKKTLVESIVSTDAPVCGIETPVDDALLLMLKSGIRTIAVVDTRNYLTGILTVKQLIESPEIKFSWNKLIASADSKLFESNFERNRIAYESRVEMDIANTLSMIDIMKLKSRVAAHEGDVNIVRAAIFDEINVLRADLEVSFKNMKEADEDQWYNLRDEFEKNRHRLSEKIFYLKEPIERLISRDHPGLSNIGPIRSTK